MSENSTMEVSDVVETIKVPEIVKSYPAKSKCKLCHGKGSLHYVEADTPKGQYRLGPCSCLTKVVKNVSDGLANDEELDFDASKDESVKVIVRKKLTTKNQS